MKAFTEPDSSKFPSFDLAFGNTSSESFLNQLTKTDEFSQVSSKSIFKDEEKMLKRLCEQDVIFDEELLNDQDTEEYFQTLEFHSPTPYRLRNSLREYQLRNNLVPNPNLLFEESTSDKSGMVTPIKRKFYSEENNDEPITPVKTLFHSESNFL